MAGVPAWLLTVVLALVVLLAPAVGLAVRGGRRGRRAERPGASTAAAER